MNEDVSKYPNQRVASTVVTKDFIRELAKYFMLFLETDFRKRRSPKRNLFSRVNKGLSVGLYLDKYSVLQKELYKNFILGFEKDNITVRSGQYQTKIPDSLRNLISHKIDKIDKLTINSLTKELVTNIEKLKLENFKSYDIYLDECISNTKRIITSLLVNSFIADLSNPLQSLGLNTETGLFQLEVDATEKIFSIIEGSFEELLKEYFVNGSDTSSIYQYFRDLFTVESVIKTLKEFFDNFNASDAYSEIYQLHRNRDMLDKTELYFYFCEISINNLTFPIFYSPIETIHVDSSVVISTDTRIFVNTKALEFVIQEYNLQTSNRESLGTKLDRIIYVEDKKNILPKLQGYINDLCEMLEITPINLKEPLNQSGKNLIVKMNNRLQFYLFDKSDESLINDYEEILEDKGDIATSFMELINDFIAKNPIKFIEEISEDWEQKSLSEKLVLKSPIPLNEEQKQVLLALKKDTCRIIILEGPPGTGKSHTITAVVCEALLEGKSVLVLSDKEEALDVVQDKITETLNHVRYDKNFQNPILRLGKNTGGLSKVIEGQVLERVREHFHAYRSQKDKLETLGNSLESEAVAELKRVSSIASKLNLTTISRLAYSENEFEGLDWLENEEIALVSKDFEQLYESVQILNNSKSRYLLPYLNGSSLRNLTEYAQYLTDYVEFNKLNIPEDDFFTRRLLLMSDLDKQALEKRLVSLYKNFSELQPQIKDQGLDILNQDPAKTDFTKYQESKVIFSQLLILVNISNSYLGQDTLKVKDLFDQVCTYGRDPVQIISAIQSYINSVVACRSRFVGFLGKTSKLESSARVLKQDIPFFDIPNPHTHIKRLQLLTDFLNFLVDKLNQHNLANSLWSDVLRLSIKQNADIGLITYYLNLLGDVESDDIIDKYTPLSVKMLLQKLRSERCKLKLARLYESSLVINSLIQLSDFQNLTSHPTVYLKQVEKIMEDLIDIEALSIHLNRIKDFVRKYPDVATKIGLNNETCDLETIDSKFLKLPSDKMKDYLEYLQNVSDLQRDFSEISTDTYQNTMDNLETLTTAKMAHYLDERIINYVDGHSGDIRTLKNLLKNKQKFPKGLFRDLKQAFPCILAGIRDYATYIPLEKNLFDLVIIDEASQVSIAQALPALIRGTKVLVLGDDKQFSNVKSGTASKIMNDQIKSGVINTLKQVVSGYDPEISSLYINRAKDNFDIKNSVLEFCRFISNYETMLKKHFRCYPEIIAYSNENFYNNGLQCMKVRAIPIGDVIKFSKIVHDGKAEKYDNINTPEIEFITEEIGRLKLRNYKGTLGVITPHREQASLIHSTLLSSELADWLKERKFKVMTFDTCQGEERDYIFYSMVATEDNDKHMYVFPSTLDSNSALDDSKVRVQRLNVGFSRARETIHFVLSKEIEKYWGTVRGVLSFYENKLHTSSIAKLGGTDQNSMMEDKIQHYFYETLFYQEFKDSVELLPQFPLGDYLKSLDRNYSHPSYKVDFLMIYKNMKIVIEYDGFKEHFVDNADATSNNFLSYMKDEDVYRQKVLEGYGYKFIRLNKFNLGTDPISNFNRMLVESVKKKPTIVT